MLRSFRMMSCAFIVSRRLKSISKGFWHGMAWSMSERMTWASLWNNVPVFWDNFGGLGPEIELLTAYAVRVRYPSDMDDPGPEESHGAFESMTVICQRVKDSLSLD